jgi:hypothetical protein
MGRGARSTAAPASRPTFVVTVDAEGDNLWQRPRRITTENARFLGRFQALCESFGVRPTYLTTHEMALCADYQRFARNLLERRAGELGMHLHAWNSPPLVALTADDYLHQPYLTEFPASVAQAKLAALTDLLQRTFGVRVRSTRAGRWGFDERYARMLAELGYVVDCSVTPLVSWADVPGDPRRAGGPDYTRFPNQPYFLDLDDISRAGQSGILEVPVTVVRPPTRPGDGWLAATARRLGGHWGHRAADRLWPRALALMPTPTNAARMRAVVEAALEEDRICLQMVVHSSELMPGGSPITPTRAHVERLYKTLEAIFEAAVPRCEPATLGELYDARSAPGAVAGQA